MILRDYFDNTLALNFTDMFRLLNGVNSNKTFIQYNEQINSLDYKKTFSLGKLHFIRKS